MNLYPLLMTPHFRHGAETPWGGYTLRDIFMKDAPDDITGVSLEVSVIEGQESMVSNGVHAGKSLARMVELWGQDLTGLEGGRFPLVLKLLDAQTDLSLQVNPDDAYAMAHENVPGKNEAWVILYAEPDARIVYGLDTKGEDLRTIMNEGRLEECLRWKTVQPGDVYYIPAGIAHAMGGGIQCYNIQETSDIAYRLYDWNRKDAQGQGRELHTEKALEVCDAERRLEKNEGTTVLCKGGSRTYYISDSHFELCRLNVSGRMPLEAGRMLFLTAMGPCEIHWPEGMVELNPFQTAVIPAALEGVTVEGNTKVLMSSLPDRERLREELGYRAENVDGLVD